MSSTGIEQKFERLILEDYLENKLRFGFKVESQFYFFRRKFVKL